MLADIIFAASEEREKCENMQFWNQVREWLCQLQLELLGYLKQEEETWDSCWKTEAILFPAIYDPGAGIHTFCFSLASPSMSISSINCFALSTHPRIQMSVFSPLIKLSSSIAIRWVKWSWNSSVVATLLHLSPGSGEKLDWHHRSGGWRISFSNLCSQLSLELGTCWGWRRVYFTSEPILYIF